MPNYISTIWILMCAKVALIRSVPDVYVIDYVIWGIAIVQFAISNDFRRIKIEKTYIFKYFIIIAFIQVFGLIQICTAFSVRNIISTLCIGVFLNNAMFYKGKIQIGYIRISYFIMIFALMYSSLKGGVVDNTEAGSLAFLLFGYILFELNGNLTQKNRSFLKSAATIIAFILTILIILVSGARTALAVIAIVLVTALATRIIKLSPRKAKVMLIIFIVMTVIGITIYINISTFSWYEKVNEYSLQLFNKNINSSRPYLWKFSLDSLSWWEVIVGKGTGMLPGIPRYATSSFHNSFIQILMQNGIIGLGVLMTILLKLCNVYSNASKTRIGKFLFSLIVGVIIYNCFETTLIQNKAFLGCIQWMILGMGVNFINKRKLVSEKGYNSVKLFKT